ncbi:hypothetical protein OG203_44835 [Nocardia sp. NBC_01499]|uniref:hypothetical protein n=1 Tax=Nocardia sp. NBC_01499 TaxID=2903597 RepID=UPI003865205F
MNSSRVALAEHPRARTALRSARWLVGIYAAISAVTFLAIVVLRDKTAVVNDAVWVRVTIVAVTAILMLLFASRAAGGAARAYLRLRIVSAIMVVAIAVIIALPGPFPVWLKIQQGMCGIVLLAVVVVVNGKHVRAAFA